MKYNEDMLAKMREATQKLMSDGPAAATATIRQALQDGLGGGHPQSRPMRDINPRPDNQPRDANPHDHAPPADFVADLLSRLRIPPGLEKGRFPLPETPPRDFVTPGQGQRPQQEEKPDASGAGRFITASYSNQAGNRAYKLYIPSAHHGQALPLMVMLHGCTQSPDDFAAGTRMNAIAEARQCLVAYPEQAQTANGAKCWNWFNTADQQHEQGEPSIIAGITRQIIDGYNIDPDQVYIAGMSAGGAMAAIMGALYPDLYAAIGVHSGLPYGSAHDFPSAMAAMKGGALGRQARDMADADAVARTHPKAIPVIVFHGDRDTTVHPRNGEKVLAQNGHKAAKTARAQDAGGPGAQVRRGKVVNGRAYTHTTHRNAEGRVVAEHWVVHGGAHAWSGGSQHGSYTDAKGPDASEEMMRFFYMQKRK